MNRALKIALLVLLVPWLIAASFNLYNFGTAEVIMPTATTCRAGCAIGQFCYDSDATSGQRIYMCEAGAWVLQGGGAGATGPSGPSGPQGATGPSGPSGPSGPGAYNGTQILTAAAGTYTPTAGTVTICFGVVAGGGGGGGATSGIASAAVGGGGAAGGYLSKCVAVVGNPTYTVGTGGTAGTALGGTGGTGVDSTFVNNSITYTAKGGLGGVGEIAGTTVAFIAGGAGVISTGGDVNGAGAPGTYGSRATGLVGASGAGGSGLYGGGGVGLTAAGTGVTGIGKGAGGGGGLVLNGSGAVTGGAGSDGAILVREYR